MLFPRFHQMIWQRIIPLLSVCLLLLLTACAEVPFSVRTAPLNTLLRMDADISNKKPAPIEVSRIEKDRFWQYFQLKVLNQHYTCPALPATISFPAIEDQKDLIGSSV